MLNWQELVIQADVLLRAKYSLRGINNRVKNFREIQFVLFSCLVDAWLWQIRVIFGSRTSIKLNNVTDGLKLRTLAASEVEREDKT
jgi:hypothetical protein